VAALNHPRICTLHEIGPNYRPFPGPGGQWKVASAGGNFPVWSAAAHELLFLSAADSAGSLHATFLLNFGDELRRRLPLK
jgi:hypothetical protein